jgi:hypothetical protein
MKRCSRPIFLVLPVAGVALALLVSGCGGGGGSPGVASLASSTTTATTTTQSNSGSSAQAPRGPGPGGRFQVAMNVGNATLGAKFSSCMRKHGVSNFPDPNSQGVIQFGSSQGIDPSSPTFRSARTACQKLLPNGGQPTPAQQAQMQQQMLAYSKCMRAHGITNFPDPSNGGIQLRNIDPNNAQFRAAQQACQGNLPFKFGKTRVGSK